MDEDLLKIYKKFELLKSEGLMYDNENAVKTVVLFKQYIEKTCPCDNQVLLDFAEKYQNDEIVISAIDTFCDKGTAAFISDAIMYYTDIYSD